MRKGEINDWGPTYNIQTDTDFLLKLKKYVLLDKDIQRLDLEISTAINKAVNGNDPEMIITLDDPKFNLEVYQQIISKVYAVTRYRVYQQI